MDPVTVALAAVLFGGGWLAGRFGRLKARPKQPSPICFCTHHYGTHDPQTGACGYTWTEKLSAYDRATSWEDRQCACVRYTGPQPVEQYWVPPAADMSIITAPREAPDA